MKELLLLIVFIGNSVIAISQLRWVNVDNEYGSLPSSVHVYRTTDSLEGKPNIAYYVVADLQDRKLIFGADTTSKRRLTPEKFYEKNDQPIVVVNTTFFSFATNQNLNVVIKDGQMVGYNIHSVPGRGTDTLTYRHPLGSAIGIDKKRRADIAWMYTDSMGRYPLAIQEPRVAVRDSVANPVNTQGKIKKRYKELLGQSYKPWKMETAVGGGPVLIQNGEVKITNNEELKFAGKAINDKHPRTAMGYTNDNKLIILVVEGRNPGKAEGASLKHLSMMLKEIGCWEALNLDGGGSSCMLVNGKETIKISDPNGQRPVPAVFMIQAVK